jgi:4-hydroxyproline epimerase
MCGHGTIGLIVTLAHLDRIGEGAHRIETPVGVVTATLHGDKSVSVTNVPSHRAARAVPVQLPCGRSVTGDVAWGGNWFFLCADHGAELVLAGVAEVTELAQAIRRGVNAQGHPEVDHVELLGPPRSPGADARNFVLCPGGAYDRSPCGTGTSAKLACMAADDALAEGEACVVESILGSAFTARFRWLDRGRGIIEPTITGTAHVNGEATLLLDERDPFCWGIR